MNRHALHAVHRAVTFDPHEKQRLRPVDEHLDEFEQVLRARDVVERYRKERMGMLRAFVAWAHIQRLGDLDVADASRWVNELHRTGLAARSINTRIASLRQPGRWVFATHQHGMTTPACSHRAPTAPRVAARRALRQVVGAGTGTPRRAFVPCPSPTVPMATATFPSCA